MILEKTFETIFLNIILIKKELKKYFNILNVGVQRISKRFKRFTIGSFETFYLSDFFLIEIFEENK